MKKDRLRQDRDEIHNLDDIIEARDESTSHIAPDRDAFDKDFDLPEDTDVDEALTFPHPRNHVSEVEDVELMDSPREDDMEDDQDTWDDTNFLPSDYSQDYDAVVTTSPEDNEDSLAEQQMHDMSHVTMEEITDEPPIERMPNVFTADEETRRIAKLKGEPTPEQVGQVIADEHTEEQAKGNFGEAAGRTDREGHK